MNSRILYSTLASLAVFLSGASTLTYEILWQRRMFLIFGASAPATTAILTAIFLGIALGSRLARPYAEHLNQPAQSYAGLELIIGIWGAIVPWMLFLSERLYVSLASLAGEETHLLSIARFVLAVLAVLPATLAMGATVPVMIRTIAWSGHSRVAWAYGINILGAMAGSLLTGFFWLRILGLSQTRWIAVGMNGLACLLLLSIRSFPLDLPAAERKEARLGEFQRPAWLAPAYFVAGFVALGLEVVWLRFLGIVNSNSTTTFTLTVVVYLLGMGLGSLAGYPLIRRWLSAGSAFLVANIGVAVSSLLTFRVLYDAVHINHASITQPAIEGTLTLSHIYQAEGMIIGLLLFLPTFFMGLVYPAVCDLGAAEGSPSDAWNAGSYFIGTLGSVVGILLVSMALIPRLGLHGCFALLVMLSAAVGAVGGIAQFPRRRPLVVLLAAALMFWAGFFCLNPQPILRFTIARQGGQSGTWQEFSVSREGHQLSEIVHIKAGRTGTVMVKKTPGSDDHFIHVDDQLVASTNLGAKVDAYMLAHLPLLLHPDPESALTVGFGSGGTSHAMTTHGVSTYCVEIEQEVPNAASFLAHQNFGILQNPQFTLIINDARDHLHITSRRYDVISTDVTNLQYKQNSSLYTVEYFERMKNCLEQGGIACAWIPMASITTEELRILMNSFRRVFPHATLWFMNHTHTNFGILVGTPEPLRIDFARLQAGFQDQAIAENLKLIGMTSPIQLAHCLHLDQAGYEAFCGDAPLHTDNDPILEFSSLLSSYKYFETFRDNLERTLEHRPTDIRESVDNFPEHREEEWNRHAIAAASFCRVVLEGYNFIVEGARGNHEAAMAAYERGAALAEEARKALPGDVERLKYFDEFRAQFEILRSQGPR